MTREDPSGMAWNFRSIGARLMGGVGAAIGSFIDYSIGYVSGYVGGGGYSGYGYSGGGYGYSGYRGGSKTKKAVQAAKPAAKVRASVAGFLGSSVTTKVGRTVYPYHSLSGDDSHTVATYSYIDGGFDSVGARLPAARGSSRTGEYGGINIMINQGADFAGRYAGADSFSSRLGSGISGTMAAVDYVTGPQDSLNKIDLGVEAGFATAGAFGVNVNPWVAAGYHGLGKPLINPDQTVGYIRDNSHCAACHGY